MSYTTKAMLVADCVGRGFCESPVVLWRCRKISRETYRTIAAPKTCPITNHSSVPETNTTRAKEQQCRSNRLRNWVEVETKNRCREISATIPKFCQTINTTERHIKRAIEIGSA